MFTSNGSLKIILIPWVMTPGLKIKGQLHVIAYATKFQAEHLKVKNHVWLH